MGKQKKYYSDVITELRSHFCVPHISFSKGFFFFFFSCPDSALAHRLKAL